MPSDRSLTQSCLWHRDIHSGNIFVSEGKITSLIDWQATWAGPFAIQARHPRLVTYTGESLLRLPPNFKDLDPAEKQRVEEQVSASILRYSYEQQTATKNPLLMRLYRLKHVKTRTNPIFFAGDSWDDDIIRFRETLISLNR